MFENISQENLYEFARQKVPCVGFNTRRVTRLVTQFFDKALTPAGLRSTQYSLLNILMFAEKFSMQDLAMILAMDRTTLTRNLGPLRKKGFVKVATGRDRRSHPITLTTKGRTAFENAKPYWEKAQSHITNELGNSNWERTMIILHRLSIIVENPSTPT